VLELFRRYFGITDLDPPRAVRDKIAGRTLLLDPTLTEALPFLFDFLGVPDRAFPAATLNPEARQRQLFDLTRRLLQARSTREPAILLLEDLHWFDRASDAFLAQLVESVRGTRTLVMLTFRPEYDAAWMAASYYHRLPLLPLRPESIAELLTGVLGPDPSLQRLRELVQERSGGNPFIMEELVQSLVDTGVLAGSQGAFRLVSPVDPSSLPATVQNLLAARIDRLSEREKQVLQTASVIGRHFSEPVLRRVAEIPEESLAAALHVLNRTEFLYPEAIYPQAEYAFKHSLIQEVAYRSQFAERRARVHAAVARTIEEIDRDKLGERSALLAYHWERGSDPREAARWHRRAAEWVGLSNVDEGLRHWTSARTLLDSLPEAQETLSERAAVRAQILSLLARLGDPDGRGESLYQEGRDLAERSGSRPVQSLLFHSYGLWRLYSGSAAEALGPLVEAARLADEVGDSGLLASARFGLSFAMTIAGRPQEGLHTADEGLRAPVVNVGSGAGPGTSNAIPMLLSARAFALIWTGRLKEAEIDLDGMIEVARKAQQPMPAYVAHLYHVFRCDLSGDARSALAHGKGAMECIKRGTYSSMLLWTHCMWAIANVLNGEWQVAREALDEVLRVGRDRQLLGVEGLALGTLARVQLGIGDPAAALALSEETIALCRRRGTRGWEIYAQLARIRALRELGGAAGRDRIEDALADATEWIETTGSDGFAPLVAVERAALAGLLDDEAGRDRKLREAHRLFTAIGAIGHAERIATEIGR
jgi:adenylate cyclase